MLRERQVQATHGLIVLPMLLVALAASIVGLVIGARTVGWVLVVPSLVLLVATFLGLIGLFMIEPNEGKVLTLFGDYRGTVRDPGLRWANPFFAKHRVSLRVRNFESEKLKVNDHAGNPIEIATIVVWKVVDTAEAIFHVDDYEHFVRVQSESALRGLALQYPYDAHEDGEVSLRSHPQEIAEQLQREVQDRLDQAGVKVLEARISHLAYAPEIAGAMLQRQQASAVVAARQRIVEGAVGMVQMALDQLSSQQIVKLDETRRAEMVANLLVVLCSDRGSQPVVSVGTHG